MAKVVYVCYGKGVDGSKPISCTNKRLLARYSGMGYENLVRIFTRQRRVYFEDSGHIIFKIYERDIIRGNQKVSRRGRGGARFTGRVY